MIIYLPMAPDIWTLGAGSGGDGTLHILYLGRLGSLLWVRSEPSVQVGNFNAPLGKGDGRGGKIMGGKSREG